MLRPVHSDSLWQRWPLVLAVLACVCFFAGLQPAAPTVATARVPQPLGLPGSPQLITVRVVGAAEPCVGVDAGACKQKKEASPAARLEPIAGAVLRAFQVERGWSVPLAEVVTDAAGRARLETQPGAHWLLVEAPGRARWSGQVQSEASPHEVLVELGTALPLRVSVRGGDAKPLAGALVLVSGADPVPQGALTSELGEASFASVGEHIDSIRVSAAGHAPSSVQPTSRDLVVQLNSPSSLLVTVVDPGARVVSGAEVWLAGLDIWPPRQLRAGVDGGLVWEGLSRGTYDLRAAQGGSVASTTVTLGRGEHGAVTLQLAPGHSVTVVVSADAAGEQPIAGADVVLVEDGLGPFPLHGRTDERGRVTLGPLPAGPAAVSVRAAGFMPESAVPVPADAARAQLTLTRGARLVGQVLDPEGQPISSATLEILGNDVRGQPIAGRTWPDARIGLGDRSGGPALIPLGELGVLPGPLPSPGDLPSVGPSRGAWVSDSSGNFRLDDVPPGRLRVVARHPDFVEATSAEVSVEPAGERSLRLVLQRGARLAGRLSDARGSPVAGARIDAVARHATQQRSALSRDDGSFEFRALATDVDLFVARPGDRLRFVLRHSLQLEPGEVRQLELTLPAERAALEVVVSSDDKRPLGGAIVSVLSLDPGAPLRRSLATDEAGEVRFADAAGLELELRVAASGFGAFETQLGAAPARVEVSLEQAVRVMGRVTQVRGRQGLAGARVVLLQGGERRLTQSDAEGEFEFRDASPGRARISVSHAGFSSRSVDRSIPVTGRVDRAHDLGAIDLEQAGSVSGTVLDADGEPVAGARVGLGLVPAFLPLGSDPSGMVQSDAAGRFTLDGVPVGRVRLSAYAAGVGRGSLNDVEIRPGDTTGPLEIVVRGGDRDPGSEGLANLAVTLGERSGAAGIEVVIVDVAAGSEAERAGLHVGDLVRAVDGVEVEDMSDARRALGGSDGSDVIIDVDRQREALSINVRREAVRR
jgi:protocatechuate 3,4-dioxygenase beta subunit